MHARIYTLKNINKNTVATSDENTLFDYFEEQGRGIDYVEEMESNTFEKEIQDFVQYFFDPISADNKVESAEIQKENGTLFLKIPTAFLKAYAKQCIKEFMQSAMQVNFQRELEAANYGAGAVERRIPLGDFYENLILDEYAIPRTFYSWALDQLAKNKDKEFITYEVVQIFDFHY